MQKGLYYGSFRGMPACLARTLRYYRYCNQLSQEQLAAQLGVSRGSLAGWETNTQLTYGELIWRGVCQKLGLNWDTETWPEIR